MAETVKKSKSPAKPRATNGKAATTKKKAGSPESGAPVATIDGSPTHEQISELARKYWAERGYAHGYHEQDWFRAEQELRVKAS